MTTHLHNKEGKRKSDIYLRRYIDNAPFEQYEWTRNYFLPSYSYSMCTNSDFFLLLEKCTLCFISPETKVLITERKIWKGHAGKLGGCLLFFPFPVWGKTTGSHKTPYFHKRNRNMHRNVIYCNLLSLKNTSKLSDHMDNPNKSALTNFY